MLAGLQALQCWHEVTESFVTAAEVACQHVSAAQQRSDHGQPACCIMTMTCPAGAAEAARQAASADG